MIGFPGIGFRLFSTKTDKELLALCNFVDLHFCRMTKMYSLRVKKLGCVELEWELCWVVNMVTVSSVLVNWCYFLGGW